MSLNLKIRLLACLLVLFAISPIKASSLDPSLLSDPSAKLIHDFFKTSVEQENLRNLAWSIRLLSEKGLRTDQWRTAVLRETHGEKLIVHLNMDTEIISSANELIRRLRMNDFIQFMHGDIEAAGPRKPDAKTPEMEAAELSKIDGYARQARLVSGMTALLSASLLGYLSIGDVKSEGQISHMTMAFNDGPVWKKMAPYVGAGVISLVYHLMNGKIKKFWSQKLWSSNRFWSRFIIDDTIHPLTVVALASTIAILPPAVVEYHGMSLIRPFLAILLSAVSLNFLESQITKGIKNGTIDPVASAKNQIGFSTVSALGRSFILNSSSVLGGILINLGLLFGVALPNWFKVNRATQFFDSDTSRLLEGKHSRFPGPCRIFLRFLAMPPKSSQ